MPEFNPPTVGQLKKAIDIAEKISKLEAELAALLGTKVPATRGRPAGSVAASAGDSSEAPAAKKKGKRGRKKRELSPEAREAIAAAQRARWAKAKKA